MASVNIINLRKGHAVRHNNEVCLVIEHELKTPPRMASYVQMSIRSVATKKVSNLRMTSNDSLEGVHLEKIGHEYSYKDTEGYHFLHPETYEDMVVYEDLIEGVKDYLIEGQLYTLLIADGLVVSIELPLTMVMTVAESSGGRERRLRQQRLQTGHHGNRSQRQRPALHQSRRAYLRENRRRHLSGSLKRLDARRGCNPPALQPQVFPTIKPASLTGTRVFPSHEDILFPHQLRHTQLPRKLIELRDLRRGEVKTACFVGCFPGFRLDLAGQHGVVVTMAEDIVEHSFEVLHLATAFCEIPTGKCLGMNDVEVECGGGFLLLVLESRDRGWSGWSRR